MTFDDVKALIKSDWLKLTALLVMMIGSWYRFDYRVAALEKSDNEIRAQVSQLSPVLERLNSTLDRMEQTMRDFPPHRHINDDDVIYPGDAELHDGKHR